jgi:predicted porin
MKKSLIALAALASIAGSVQAQSSVTLYGIIDMNVGTSKSESTTAKQTIFNSSESAIATSRLGFKGVEDLGGGLKLAFTLEGCLNPNNGTAGTGVTDSATAATTTTNRLFNREAQVELSGAFGAVRFGTTDLLATNNIMDGLINVNGNISNNATTDVGADANQVIRYTSPKFNGLSVEVGYAGNQASVNDATTTGSFAGVGVMYVQGPIAAYASQAERNDAEPAAGKADKLKQTMYGVKYTAPFATFAAGQSKWSGIKNGTASNGFTGYGFQGDGAVSSDATDNLTSTRLGVSVPTPMLGAGVSTQLVYGKDKTETALAADAKIWNLSVTKAFSKRTTGYVSFRDTNYNLTTNNDTQKLTAGVVHTF